MESNHSLSSELPHPFTPLYKSRIIQDSRERLQAGRAHGIWRLLARKFKRYFCCLQERTPGVPSARTQHRIAFGERAGQKVRRMGTGFGTEGKAPTLTGP